MTRYILPLVGDDDLLPVPPPFRSFSPFFSLSLARPHTPLCYLSRLGSENKVARETVAQCDRRSRHYQACSTAK